MTHSELVKGAGLGPRSKETMDRCWNDLAVRLNSHFGAQKTGQRWKRYWADLKHKVKTRVIAKRQDMGRTGGGSPNDCQDFTETEKKVLAILGEGAVFGDSQHRVPAFSGLTNTALSQATSTSQPSCSSHGSVQWIASTCAVTENVEIFSDPDSHQHTSVTEQDPVPEAHLTTHEETEQEAGISDQVAAAPINAPKRSDGGTLFPSSSSLLSERAGTSNLDAAPRATGSRLTNRSGRGTPLPRRTNLHLGGSPISSRQPKRRRIVMSNETDTSWVIDLERRRVEAEEKLAGAVSVIAEASKIQAEAAKIQANAALTLSEAIKMQAEVFKNVMNKNN